MRTWLARSWKDLAIVALLAAASLSSGWWVFMAPQARGQGQVVPVFVGSGEAVVNPSGIAVSATSTGTLAVPGAVIPKSVVLCGPQGNPFNQGGYTIACYVSATNVVTWNLGNPGVAVSTPTSQTWRFIVYNY